MTTEQILDPTSATTLIKICRDKKTSDTDEVDTWVRLNEQKRCRLGGESTGLEVR